MSPDDRIGEVTLLPHQSTALPIVVDALGSHNAAIDASDLGTGKSYVGAFSAVKRANRPLIVVLCPKAVVPAWCRIFALMGLTPRDYLVTNYERVRSPKGVPEVIEWWPGTKRFKWAERVGFIVFDEAHNVRSPDGTLNSKLAIAAKLQNIPTLFLSATLAESPAHFRAIGFALGLHNGSGFFQWALSKGCSVDPWGKLVLKRSVADKTTKELNALLFPEYGVRVRKADIPGFPECELILEAFDFNDDGGIEKAYEEMAKEIAELEEKAAADGKHKDETVQAMIAQLRARQRVELLKVPTVARMTLDALEEGQSVAIFVNFTETLEQLLVRLSGTKPAVIRGVQGEAGQQRRQDDIDRFQRNETRVAVVNIQSGGAGIGLHDLDGNFPRLGLLFPSFNATTFRQATGRIHRAGAKSKSTQIVLFAAGTVEEKVMNKLKRKLSDLDSINDGDLIESVDEWDT